MAILPGQYTQSSLESMGVRFPKRENPFAKYFSKESPISTTQFEEPKMDNYFSSEDVLGRPTAKNTAQRGSSESEKMKAAYDELVKPADPFKLQLQKEKSKGVNIPFYQTSFGKEAESIIKSEQESRGPMLGGLERFEFAKRKQGIQNFYQALAQGVSWEDAVKKYPDSGFGSGFSMGWSGSGTVGQTPAQTSTSNIAPTGYKPMTMEQSSAGFQSKYGTAGTEGQYREFARGSYENIPLEMVNPTLAAQKKAEAEAQKKTTAIQTPQANTFTTFQGKPLMGQETTFEVGGISKKLYPGFNQ